MNKEFSTKRPPKALKDTTLHNRVLRFLFCDSSSPEDVYNRDVRSFESHSRVRRYYLELCRWTRNVRINTSTLYVRELDGALCRYEAVYFPAFSAGVTPKATTPLPREIGSSRNFAHIMQQISNKLRKETTTIRVSLDWGRYEWDELDYCLALVTRTFPALKVIASPLKPHDVFRSITVLDYQGTIAYRTDIR